METTKRKRAGHRPKAATEEVLGNAAAEVDIDPKWRRHYQNLQDLRNDLLNRQASLVKDVQQDPPTFSLHMADAATENYDRDFALSMISAEQDALYEIDQALSRIKNSTYGICEMTGKPIERERLNTIPWTRFSAEAEEELEKKGEAFHTHLGQRQSVPRSDTSNQIAEDEA
jgi:DnaK suppressor protein